MQVFDNPTLTAISPVDGRYRDKTSELSIFLSEQALIRYRIKIEIEYLIALGKEKNFTALAPLSTSYQTQLRKYYRTFSPTEAQKVKEIEKQTNHDVKAVEYYLREQFQNTRLNKLSPWIHFALTSEDINNLAYSLMWRDALKHIYLPGLKSLYRNLRTLARRYKQITLLSLTHGQPATPTTVGKELAVFASRLQQQMQALQSTTLTGKLAGASGTWAAHQISFPQVNWLAFSTRFVKSLGLKPNLLTTQIEPHDNLAASYQALIRVNTILIDLCRDVWTYISRGIFQQKKVAGEVGSSTMPHKINPIQFENAEGNLGIANALLDHLAVKLPVSRLQRDLTDSTVLRTQGVPLAHSLLAIKNIINGLPRLVINKTVINLELENHWEVLAEAIQMILRKSGRSDAYEQLKEFTRGHSIDKESIRSFIADLDIPENERLILMELLPQNYNGLAPELVELLK
ncbi:MAG: adenylosuccinate lyase [Candidatus Marinimicrobia bacterium]|nr:adenylosuccinate lyase [Candidatus Neomarinimicrobiota bacterium]